MPRSATAATNTAHQIPLEFKRRSKKRRPHYWAELNRRRHVRRKVAVLDRYGWRCVFCGEERYELLTIDHVMSDGRAHRESPEFKRVGNLIQFVAGIPIDRDRFRILCFNCNCARGFFGIEPGGKEYQSAGWWRQRGDLKRKP